MVGRQKVPLRGPTEAARGVGPQGSRRFVLSSPGHVPVPHTLQKVVLSSASGPQLDLPLVLGPPLQLKLGESGAVLSQRPKKEILALPLLDPASLLNLWVQPQGRLFLGALPGKSDVHAPQHAVGIS